MAGWQSGVGISSGRSGFYITCTLIPWLILLIFFTLMMLSLHTRLQKII